MTPLLPQRREGWRPVSPNDCGSLLRVSKLDLHRPTFSSLNRKPSDLAPATVGGGSTCLETETGRLVGGYLHEKLSPIDLTGLLFLDETLAKSGQILTKSIEIRPNLDEIHWNPTIVDLHRFLSEKNHRWTKPKPTRPVVSGRQQRVSFSVTQIWRVDFGLGTNPTRRQP